MSILVYNHEHSNDLNDDSCFLKYKKIIWVSIAAAFIIIGIIILLCVLLTKKKKKIDPPDEEGRCLQNNQSNGECIVCKKEFELFKGKCISYAFSATYKKNYNDDNVEIFNSNKVNNLFAIKINDDIIEPNSVFSFDNITNFTVYFYLNETLPFSLSNMFQNNNQLVDFSFNEQYMKDFSVNDMKGMFSGCTSLTSISLYLPNAQNLTDISYLFSDCIYLNSINLSLLNSYNLKNMNNLFYNCISLKNIRIDNLNTDNVIQMKEMFYNCNLLSSINVSLFNIENVKVICQKCFIIVVLLNH